MRSTHFSWDPAKADSNYRKHGVQFEDALIAVEDPLAISRHQIDHDRPDERWITLGEAYGTLLHVVHTLEESDDQTQTWGRIISARHPPPDERWQYESGQYRIEEARMINKSNPDQWIRGRFYREGMVFTGPVQVESGLIAQLSQLARQRGTSTSAIANELLRRAIADGSRNGVAETTKAQTIV
jgi:uncharacterized DUF497 family protein